MGDADFTLEQRIKYLLEHGGVLDDPLADVRKATRIAVWLSAICCLLTLVQFAEMYWITR